MIIQHDRGEHKPRLIEDIIPKQAEPFIDVRNDRVRHQAIGALDRQYLLSRMKGTRRPKIKSSDEEYVIDVRRPWPPTGYTRIPPLMSLPLLYDKSDQHLRVILDRMRELMYAGAAELAVLASRANRATRRHLHKIGGQLAGMKAALTGAAMALIAWLAAINWPLPHRRYVHGSGVVIEWPASVTKRAKAAAPALLLLLLIVVTVLAWPSMTTAPSRPVPQQHAQTARNKHAAGASSNAATAKNASSNTPPAGSPATSPVYQANSYAGSSSRPATSGASAPTSASTATTPVSGGLVPSPSTGGGSGGLGGGGPAPVPSPPSSLIPSTTVTVPSTTVSPGGQPLVSTGGGSLTLP